ncbi:50S ribosomal protein L25 [Patescibacteria group bacterium]|nr:MAG: 50S ribosomal protein L25 [Patescibacteria group bacterium]
MQTYQLNANVRTTKGRKNYLLRNEEVVPAIVYGAGIDAPTAIQVDRPAFVRLYKAAGESGVVELTIDGKGMVNVLIHDIQTDPLRDEVIHADFRALDMTKPIETHVKLVFTGESNAVKNLGGTFTHSVEEVTVRALPKDLPGEIVIDISTLVTFDDIIRVSDIAVPAGVTILDDAQGAVASVEAPRSEEEIAALDTVAEADVTKVEVEKKGKEEEEGAEAAEGAEGKPEAKKEEPKAKK